MATHDTTPLEVSVANPKRRKLLIAAASVVGTAGLVAAGIPFIESWWPSERARAAGAPVTVDASKLEPGQQITVPWRGRPVWVLRRTPEMLERMRAKKHLQRLRDPDSEVESQQPAYAENEFRSIHKEHLV
ncbi:MAG TPA: ubiquinol-cytochrome c reductase iron-sulfur subunit, partial [Gammaproteobacteria bacterium]|nr:ubiquinol-cytochrome c reductase iron-sulfur subunit [Gammaproteobacteria bacterium]